MQSEIDKILNHFTKNLATLRTGRAHPGLLDGIAVTAYGGVTPLKHLASVVTEDASTLLVTLYDPTLISNVEKAIREQSLNPNAAGSMIRVPIPGLTLERRKEMVKRARAEAEQARVAIRCLRRERNEQLKASVKQKTMSEDVAQRQQDQVQKSVDQAVQQVDRFLLEKETELDNF